MPTRSNDTPMMHSYIDSAISARFINELMRIHKYVHMQVNYLLTTWGEYKWKTCIPNTSLHQTVLDFCLFLIQSSSWTRPILSRDVGAFCQCMLVPVSSTRNPLCYCRAPHNRWLCSTSSISRIAYEVALSSLEWFALGFISFIII